MNEGAWYLLRSGRRRWLTPEMAAARTDIVRRLAGAPSLPSSPADERETADIGFVELEAKEEAHEEGEIDGYGD